MAHPFCPGKKKQQYKYRDLLQHVFGVGTGAAWRKAKAKAQHLALANYLTFELAKRGRGVRDDELEEVIFVFHVLFL